MFVRGDAMDASKARLERKARARKASAHETAYSKILAQIDLDYGAVARQLTGRYASHREDFLTGQTQHEIKNLRVAIQRSLDSAQVENRRASSDKEAIAGSLVRIEELFDLMWNIMEATRRYAKTEEPDLSEENLRDVVSEAHRTLVLSMTEEASGLAFSNEVPYDLVAEIIAARSTRPSRTSSRMRSRHSRRARRERSPCAADWSATRRRSSSKSSTEAWG